MKSLKHNSGFTMIEVIMVLLVLGILIAISASFFPRSKEASISFESRLIQDLHNAQLTAVSGNKQVTVYFDTGNQSYSMVSGYVPNEKVLSEVKLPENVELLGTSSLTLFRYNPSGNTNTFGVVKFIVDHEPLNIHFYLARGRFYVEKP
ncbi:prepilin-type N-terminal cleavage/methylation domain-containing protein [Jeotgalibacillus alimentarius]